VVTSNWGLTPTQRHYLESMDRAGRLKKGVGYHSTQTVRLLAERGLAQVSWWGGVWEAQITPKGREALCLRSKSKGAEFDVGAQYVMPINLRPLPDIEEGETL
jgi:hypothetical protein